MTAPAPYAETEFIFQKNLLNATDSDGIITGFAYRVKKNEPDRYTGNHYIDMTGGDFRTWWTPASAGVHYKTNADQTSL